MYCKLKQIVAISKVFIIIIKSLFLRFSDLSFGDSHFLKYFSHVNVIYIVSIY